ncbi:MAG: BON domain-containing protein [Chloroflexia bacterium]
MADDIEMKRDSYTGELVPNVGGDVLDLGPEDRVEGEEPTFAGDPGTTDVMDVVENGATYFPATDPVVKSVDNGLEGLEVTGGFAESSLEEPGDAQRDPPQFKFHDDEIAENVITALRDDAYTTDLDIDVEVVEGVVYLRGRVNSIEDVEQAEEVAGRVEGVVDVEEELEIV